MPYCWPLTCQPAAAWPSSLIQPEVIELRLASLPEVSWVASWPPPHCWKMSGGLSDFRAIGILVVNRSLWIAFMLIVTLGCAAWNAATTLCQTPRSGWVLPLFHQVRGTFAVVLELALVPALLELLVLVLVLLVLLHAAIASAAATAVATMAGFLEPRMRSHLLTMPRNSWCRGVLLLAGPPGAAESGGRGVMTPAYCSETLGNFSEVPLS